MQDQPRHFPAGSRIGVLTTEPVGILDYLAPEGGVLLGQPVLCPLGPRRVMGIVWGRGVGDFDAARLRPVGRALDAAALSPEFVEFLARAAEYTLTPLTAMARMALRAPDLDRPPAARRIIVPAGDPPGRMTEARARVLQAIADHGGLMPLASYLDEDFALDVLIATDREPDSVARATGVLA